MPTVLESPEAIAGHILPLADNTYDLGSAAYSFRNLYVDNLIYVTGTVMQGDFTPSADGTYDLGSSTYEWQDLHIDGVAYLDTLRVEVAGRVNDDIVLAFGNDSDIGVVLRSTQLAAGATLTGVFVGTPITGITPANSLIISNTASLGDIVLAARLGANSIEVMKIDTSAGIVIWNEGSTDIDFRWESNNYSFMFHIDAGNDAILFGNTADSCSKNRMVYINRAARTATADTSYADLWVEPAGAITIPLDACSVVASVYLAEPNITATGDVTIASTLYIANAPDEGVTINAALYVASGDTNLSTVTLRGAVAGGDQGWTNVGDMTFATASILASGSVNGNTLLIKAGGLSGTTFITLTAGDTDTMTLGAFTLSGSVDASGNPITSISYQTIATAGYISCIVDDSYLRIYGGTAVAGKGAKLELLGEGYGIPGAFLIYTPNAAENTDTERLRITGDADTAVATWSAVTHTGFEATSSMKAAIIYGSGSTYLRIGDAATTQRSLASEDDLMVSGSLEVNSYAMFTGVTQIWTRLDVVDTGSIQAGISGLDNDYFTFKAHDNASADGTWIEVARVAAAGDPYFAMGGSQEFKFYNSGYADCDADIHMGDNKYISTQTAVADYFSISTYNTNDSAWKVALRFANTAVAAQGALMGFFGATPVKQQLKADFNDWAAATDVAGALAALGLIDSA